MSSQALSQAIQQLKQEHIRLCKELERVDQALSTLGSLEDVAPAKRGRGKKVKVAVVVTGRAKRKISAAARKRMSEAAKARWAASRVKKDAPKKAEK
ncbi:MAG: hypothetical protein P4M01_11055 [Acidobacteriota bacterium]|nr:hypothetical protein [Acidobacteriota bacterium]